MYKPLCLAAASTVFALGAFLVGIVDIVTAPSIDADLIRNVRGLGYMIAKEA